MKLPVWKPVESPDLVQMPRENVAAAGSVGQEAVRVGESVEHLGLQMARTEALIEQSRQAVIGAKVISGLDAHMDDLLAKASADESPTQFTDRFKTSATDYLEQATAGMGELERNALLAHGTTRISAMTDKARATAIDLRGKAVATDALNQIDALKRRGTVEDLTTAEGLIAGLTEYGYFTPEGGASLRANARKEAVQNAFGRMLAANPQGAMNALTRRTGLFAPDYLDDADHERLMGAARSELEHQRRLAQEEEDRKWTLGQRSRALREQAKADAREEAMGGLYTDILDGKDTGDTVRALIAARTITDEDVTKATNFAHAFPQLDVPDDPETALLYIQQVSKDEPDVTVDDIKDASGLSISTKKALMFHLQAVRQAMRSQQSTEWRQDFSTANSELTNYFSTAQARSESQKVQVAQLGISSFVEFRNRTMKRDPTTGQLVGENPLAVAHEIMSRMDPVMQRYNRLDVEQTETKLPARYRDPVNGKQNLKDDYLNGKIDGSSASDYSAKLRRLEMLRQQEQPQAPKPGAPGQKPRL